MQLHTKQENLGLLNHLQLGLFVPLPLSGPGSAPVYGITITLFKDICVPSNLIMIRHHAISTDFVCQPDIYTYVTKLFDVLD